MPGGAVWAYARRRCTDRRAAHQKHKMYDAGSRSLTCSTRKELEGTDSGAETDITAPPKPAPTADADSAEVAASLDVARIPPWATCGMLEGAGKTLTDVKSDWHGVEIEKHELRLEVCNFIVWVLRLAARGSLPTR